MAAGIVCERERRQDARPHASPGAHPDARQEALRSLEGAMVAYWTSLARGAGGAVARDGGVTWTYTGSPVLNRVVETRLSAGEADAGIEGAIQRYARLGAGFAWLVGPLAEPADLARRLERRGFSLAQTLTGMSLDLTLPSAALDEASGPPELVVREAADAAARRDWLDVIHAAFRLPGAARPVFDAPLSQRGGVSRDGADTVGGERVAWRRWVGYVDRRAVTTATLVADPGAGAAGLFLVGTVPDVARGGLATAMTWHALRAARAQGHTLAVLQATPEAVALYGRMGFVERCRIPLYRWAPPPSLGQRALGAARRVLSGALRRV